MAACLAMVAAGCAGLDLGAQDAAAEPGAVPVGFPECAAETYDFVGEATLRELGLEGAVPAPLPEPNRPAMVWVTHDLLPHDFGEPGGPEAMTRMLCFEFADGSGGSGWPVDPAWRAPGAAPAVGEGDVSPGVIGPALVVIGVMLVVALISLIAFRTRRRST
jgi:hypothetical protein